MKVIAYYLPQYHEVEENNRWWGAGFTEWTNVKRGKSLFNNHNQPRIPMDGYYTLIDRDVIMHQADIANKYGVYGMAFYHYWFNGKTLLEKPAENLLVWKDIPMRFMFFWANHNWIRSWDGTKKILLTQTYGEEDDWKSHFEYMLPFLADTRYIKMNNKPAIGIYKLSDIPYCDRMIECWNKMAINNGFAGVYIVETITDSFSAPVSRYSNAVTLRGPNIAVGNMFEAKVYEISKKFPTLQPFLPTCYPLKYSYKKAKKKMLSAFESYKCDKDVIFGDFVGWDNTCRHGKRGSVAIGQTPEVFECYLRKYVELSKSRGIEYIFMNAWNEWAEGMYLEPDTIEKYSYLNVIKNVINMS